MSMPLERWCWEVDRHLDRIEAGADMVSRHADALPLRPGFESKAEVELQRCEATLESALATVRRALAMYRAKEVER